MRAAGRCLSGRATSRDSRGGDAAGARPGDGQAEAGDGAAGGVMAVMLAEYAERWLTLLPHVLNPHRANQEAGPKPPRA